jgi:hypothetical protein
MKKIRRVKKIRDQSGRIIYVEVTEAMQKENEFLEQQEVIMGNCENCNKSITADERKGQCAICNLELCGTCYTRCICGKALCFNHRFSFSDSRQNLSVCGECLEALQERRRFEDGLKLAQLRLQFGELKAKLLQSPHCPEIIRLLGKIIEERALRQYQKFLEGRNERNHR